MTQSDDPMSAFWMPAEHQALVLKIWMTGEPAKTFVLQRLSEKMKACEQESNSRASVPCSGGIESLVIECCKEALERIDSGQFTQPPYWIMEICDLFNLARCWDGQQILQSPVKRKVLQTQLAAIVAQVKGAKESLLESTLRAVEQALGTMKDRRKPNYRLQPSGGSGRS